MIEEEAAAVEVTRVVAEEESPPESVTVNLKTYVCPAAAVNVVFDAVGVDSVTPAPPICVH
jgi:hypothetical protein